MSMLKNQKHELFCQAVVRGMTLDAAYEHAGFDQPDADRRRASGSRLAQREYIKQRIQDLRAEVEKNTVKSSTVDMAWWRTEVKSTYDDAKERGDLTTRRAMLETIGKHLGSFDADKVSYSGNVKDRKLDKSMDINDASALYKELLAAEPEGEA